MVKGSPEHTRQTVVKGGKAACVNDVCASVCVCVCVTEKADRQTGRKADRQTDRVRAGVGSKQVKHLRHTGHATRSSSCFSNEMTAAVATKGSCTEQEQKTLAQAPTYTRMHTCTNRDMHTHTHSHKHTQTGIHTNRNA